MNEFDEVEYIMDKVAMEDRDFAEFIDFVEDICNENEQLKKQYFQMRNLYFENAEDICENCKHQYLVPHKQMQGYYNQRCEKGYDECPKGTMKFCGDFELKDGD